MLKPFKVTVKVGRKVHVWMRFAVDAQLARESAQRAAAKEWPGRKVTINWPELDTEHLRLCAEGEGGRAALAMEGYGDAATAAYFAREAARYAATILDAEVL